MNASSSTSYDDDIPFWDIDRGSHTLGDPMCHSWLGLAVLRQTRLRSMMFARSGTFRSLYRAQGTTRPETNTAAAGEGHICQVIGVTPFNGPVNTGRLRRPGRVLGRLGPTPSAPPCCCCAIPGRRQTITAATVPPQAEAVCTAAPLQVQRQRATWHPNYVRQVSCVGRPSGGVVLAQTGACPTSAGGHWPGAGLRQSRWQMRHPGVWFEAVASKRCHRFLARLMRSDRPRFGDVALLPIWPRAWAWASQHFVGSLDGWNTPKPKLQRPG